ncbi:MAG TPA: hypothetical protein VH583_14715 [Vicinamibacterales bacterium]|jgi:hypothetical protein
MKAWIPRVVVAGIVLATVAGVAAFRRDSGIGVPTAPVTRGAFVDTLQLRGQIRPEKSIVLTGPSAGGSDLLILDLARNGGNVNAGDVVVQFDPTMQERTLEQKQSELKQAEADIEKAESEQRRRTRAAQTDMEQARSAVERARLDLAKIEVQSRVEGEKLKIVFANTERHVKEAEQKLAGERMATDADIASARQKREKALYDVRETERIIASLTIRAPRAGMLSILPNYRAGGASRTAPEFKRGDRAWFGAPIAELPDLSTVQLACRVDEADRARVQSGLAARVSIDALPDSAMTGTVNQIAIVAKPDFTTWPPVRNFDVLVVLAKADSRLRPGMSATARVELERLNDVLLIPAAAVFPQGNSSIAYVVSGRSVEARKLTVLRRSRDQVAVQAGLRENEQVALTIPDVAGGAR